MFIAKIAKEVIMEPNKISKSVLKRLPGYLAYLKSMPESIPCDFTLRQSA